MNVMFVGPYRQNDSWGMVSRNFLEYIYNHASEDINLITRPIYFNQQAVNKIHSYIEDSESKKLTNDRDILIQFGLPSYLNYNGTFKKNVAVTRIECNVKNTDWPYHLNMFDEVVVFSDLEKNLLEESGVTTKILNAAAPYFGGITVAKDKIEKFENFGNKFVFFSTASASERSGTEAVVTAYLSQYSVLDKVMLVLFCDGREHENIIKMIRETRDKLNIFKNTDYYPPIAVSKNDGTEVLLEASDAYNCYINVSSASSISIVDAIVMGSKKVPTIILDTIMSQQYPLSVKSVNKSCLLEQRPVADLYSGEFEYQVPDMLSLKENMKRASGSTETCDKCVKMLDDYFNYTGKQYQDAMEKVLCM